MIDKPINVLSLFDGMSCGQIALEKAGIPVANYFASEVDKFAIKVTKSNYPNTIHLGSVTDLDYVSGYIVGETIEEAERIDLLIGGSPCQNFSFAGSRKGMVTKDNIEILTLDQYLELKEAGFKFQGQSFLFWEYVRMLKLCKPKYFLLENVKMAKKWENLITSIMEVEPILINSSLVSAQNRKRLYWTNIPDIAQPEDLGFVIRDILETNVNDRYFLSSTALAYMSRGSDYTNNNNRFKHYGNIADEKAHCLVANAAKGIPYGVVAIPDFVDILPCRPMTITGLTEPTKNGLIHVGNASDINGNDCLKRVYGIDGKAPTLTTCAGGNTEPKLSISGNTWRRFTPLECERLQTVPDGYTSSVSDTQRYKMLGNGWTVDVISHILKNIKL